MILFNTKIIEERNINEITSYKIEKDFQYNNKEYKLLFIQMDKRRFEKCKFIEFR